MLSPHTAPIRRTRRQYFRQCAKRYGLPTAAIIRQAAEWQAHLVGLSVAFAHQLPVAKEVIAQLAEHFGSARPAAIIGGLAINRFSRLADMVGADVFSADASAAVGAATRLVGV